MAPRAAAPIGGAIVTGAPPALATFLIALDLGCGEQHQTRFSPARPGLAPGASYEELELLDDDRDDELDDPPPPDELLLDELLELPVLDDELDDELVDEPLDELLVLDELLDGELDELLEGELDELDDDVLPPLDELPVLLDDEPSGEVGSVVHPVSPAAITATGAPDSSSRKSRRRLRSVASGPFTTTVLRMLFGTTILH